MVTLYYKISQPLLTTIAIFEWIWITSARIDGSKNLELNRLIVGLGKRLLQFLKCFTILFLHISPEWLTRIKSNVADTLYGIWSTLSDFFGTIYNGFRIPWTKNHINQTKPSAVSLSIFKTFRAIKLCRLLS